MIGKTEKGDLLLGLLALLVASVALGVGSNHLASEDRLALGRPLPAKRNYELFPAVALDYSKKETFLFLDVRARPNYLLGHIPGAINVPVHELGRKFPDLKHRIMTSGVVVYCDNAHCPKADQARAGLRRLGREGTIWIVLGGFEAWQRAGYPIESGEPR
ncbi:MAG: rhodanese-like domain-containing protein [Vulcanimicrobiota bacterium]